MSRILFTTDFSACADEAFGYASELAHRAGATLHLLHVIDDPDLNWFGGPDAERSTSAARDDLRAEAEDRLMSLAAPLDALDVETAVVSRSNATVDEAVLEYAETEAVDLIVLGTHGRRGVDRFVLGSVAETVLRRAPCPVLTIREGTSRTESETLIRTVLAPIDFSEASRHALAIADGLAGAFEAELHLLFVGEERTVPTFSDTGLPGLGVVKMDPDIVDNADEALRHLYERRGGEAPDVSYHVEEGHVASTISSFAADASVDVIVMATRARKGMDRFLVGSTTERVVRSAPCPVLTTRRREEESDAEAHDGGAPEPGGGANSTFIQP